MHSLRKKSSKARLDLVPRSSIRKGNGCSSPSCMTGSAPLRRPATVWVGAAGDVLDPARCERDEEEHVGPLQEHRLDAEKVARTQIAADEFANPTPARSSPS